MNRKYVVLIVEGILLLGISFSGFHSDSKSQSIDRSEKYPYTSGVSYISPNQTNYSSRNGLTKAEFQANQNYRSIDGRVIKRVDAQFIPDTLFGYSHRLEQEFCVRINTAKMNALRVELQDRYLEFRFIGTNPVTGNIDGKKIRVHNLWEGTDVEFLATDGELKEYMILNKPKENEFVYEIISNMTVEDAGSGGLAFSDSTGTLFISPPPIALNPDSGRIEIQTKLLYDSGRMYYKITVDTAGVVYPILIDPTIIFQQGRGGYQKMEDTYLEQGVDYDNGGRKFGWLGVYGNIFRPLMKFNLDSIPGNTTIESAKLTLWIHNLVNDTIRYRIHLLKNKFYEGNGDVVPPDGDESGWNFRHYNDTTWAKSGADSAGADYYSTPVVYDTVSNLSPNDSFEVDVTSLVQKITGYQKIYSNHGFFFHEVTAAGNKALTWISSEHDSTTKRPRLTVIYSTALFRPYNSVMIGLTDSSVIVSARDSSLVRYGMAVYTTDSIRVGDSIRVAGGADTFVIDTISLPQYSPNFPDTLLWGVFDSLRNINYSAPFSGHTRAVLPESIRVDVVTDSTIHLFFFDTLNPSYTKYALYDSCYRMYRDTLGETTRVAVWATVPAWDSTMIAMYNPNTPITLSMQVQNQDSIITPGAVTDCTWVYAAVPESTIVSVIDSIHLLFRIKPGKNPAYTYFAIQDSISGFFVDVTSKRLRSPAITVDSLWAFGRYEEWGGKTGDTLFVSPGMSYYFRTYSKDGNSNP